MTQKIHIPRRLGSSAVSFALELGPADDGAKIRVRLHRLLGQDPGSMVVDEKPVDEVNRLCVGKVMVLRCDKFDPSLARMPPKHVIKMRIKLEGVLVKVCEEAIRAKHACNFHKLVVIVMTMEEGLFAEDHSGKHAA
mmetsp:Transcript_15243/g.28172  ORF Transcript_15243/g.28172 Transcript_15243/m.28172 type:complete len:137 (+) Transcript_15243:112-522(+)